MRKLAHLLCTLPLALSLTAVGAGAQAQSQPQSQTWPTRHITLVVGFGAGSAVDVVGRILAARMSEIIGQQVVIENIGGAGGTIAVTRVARAEPDGYQMVLGSVDTFAQIQSLYAKPPYNAATDFTPVGLAVEQPLILVTRKEIAAANLKEFVDHLKANPGKLQYGSGGTGSGAHLACLQIVTAIGADVAHVPYRSSAPALQDMVAGSIDFYCPLAAVGIPLITANQAKPLAMLAEKRSVLLPDLPTAREQGVSIVDSDYWTGLFLPKGVPEPIATKLNAALGATLDTAAIAARLREIGTFVVAPERRSPAYLQSFVESEIARWAVAIKASGVKLN